MTAGSARRPAALRSRRAAGDEPPVVAGEIRRSVLPGGLRVVTEAMPHLRSVALGFWVAAGATDEADEVLGASHFLEHLLFKGTARRSAADIARAVEGVGGDMNAFTTQEYTAFHLRMPDTHLVEAVDLLSDVVWAPAFRPEELEAERQVILEEIRMRDDDPDDVVTELADAALFAGHRLGRSVLGTTDTIRRMRRDDLVDHHERHYRPADVVVAAAGNLDHDEVVRLVAERLPDRPGGPAAHDDAPLASPRARATERRPTEQAHMVLAMRAIPRDDPDRHALAVLNQALGGGMSSRLFQEVRERRGLAYAIYSYRAGYRTTGELAVYAGTAPERAAETLSVIRGQLEDLAAGGPGPDELAAAKGHLRGATALALESSISRMHRIGRAELTLGEVPSLDELVAAVEAVDEADVARVAERVLGTPERTLAVVGPFGDDDLA